MRPSRANLRALAVRCCSSLCFVLWHVLTSRALLPPSSSTSQPGRRSSSASRCKVARLRIWDWFAEPADIYVHLWVTLLETVLAFGIGTVLGLACGLWLALAPIARRDPRSLHQGRSTRCRA